MTDPIVQGSTRFVLLRDALLRELQAEDITPRHASPWTDADNAGAVVLDGRYNIDLALRRALQSVGLLVELT